MNTVKKVLTVGVVMATIVWTMGLAAFVPAAQAVSIPANTNVKGSASTVWYYAADGNRYTYPTESTWFSWWSDFSDIMTLTNDEIASISLAGNVVVRPGTFLVKIQSVPKVYAVEPEGLLRHIASETAAQTLWGTPNGFFGQWQNWVIDVPDGFWPNYSDLNMPLDGTEYPEGQLVKTVGSPDVFVVDAGNNDWRHIASESAFNANNFQWRFLAMAPASVSHTASTSVTAGECQYIDVSQGGGCGTVTPTGGPLTCALDSSTPAGQTVPTDIVVDVLKFNCTAGDEAVNLNSLTLSAGGLGDPVNIDDITLFANGAKIGTSKNMSSTREAVFNFATPVEFAAYSSKTILAKATFFAEGYYQLGVAGSTHILSDASSVGGTFPIWSNTMHATGTATSVGALTIDGMDNDTTAYVGEDDVTVAEFDVEAGPGEDVWFSGITLKNAGSLNCGEMGNLELWYGATLLDTTTLDCSKYAAFSFDQMLIQASDTESFKITGDFDGGSDGDTLTLYLKDKTDLTAIGKSTGYQVAITNEFTNDTLQCTEIELTSGQLTINFDNTAVPAADVKYDSDNVVVGKLQLTSNTEPILITELGLTLVDNGGFLIDHVENVELVDLATGGIIDLNCVALLCSTDEELLITGTKSYDVRLDVTTLGAEGDQFRVKLAASEITAEGDTSGSAITDITPTSVESSIMTIVKSDLRHQTEALSDITVIKGTSDVKVYKGTLKASTASDVTLNKIVFNDSDEFINDNVSAATLQIEGSNVKTLSGKIAAGTPNVLTFDGLTYTIGAGKQVTFYLIVNVSSGAQATDQFNVSVASITAKDSDNKTVTPTPDTTESNTVTIQGEGELDVYLSQSEEDADRDLHVVGGKTSGLIAALKFDAQLEAVKVRHLYLRDAGGAAALADIARVELIDSDMTTVVATTTDLTVDAADLVVSFEDWNKVIDEAGVKYMYVRVVTKEIGSGAEQTGTSGQNIQFVIDGVEAQGVSSGASLILMGNTTPGIVAGDGASEYEDTLTTYLATNVGARLTGIVRELPDGVLAGGSQIIGQFKMTAESGNNTNSFGEIAKVNLASVDFSFNNDGVNVGDGTIAADIQIYWSSSPGTVVECDVDSGGACAVIGTGVGTYDLSSLADLSGTGSLVVKALHLSGVDSGDSIQVSLNSIGTGIIWDDTIGGAIIGVRLSYDNVDGGIRSK